jgi:glycosyltransferase involved in cell wall biosynthesis
VTYGCYLDSSNGASVASRAMLEGLARRGFACEALSGLGREHGGDLDLGTFLLGSDTPYEIAGGENLSADSSDPGAAVPVHYRLAFKDVFVTLARRISAGRPEPGDDAYGEFLRLYETTLNRFRPEILVNYGASRLSREVRARASSRGVAVVFVLHNCNYHNISEFDTADAVIVPSRFAADHYRKALGLDCTVLSNLLDLARVRVADRDPRYLTLVNPSYEKGVYAFARIADELGRRRPDIPLLVVESRGSEQTLADCGLDLRLHGTVNLMSHTDDPRHFWKVTRVCLMPSLAAETQGLAAVEAMANAIPVIASDRGALPETLGGAGIVLPLPERLNPTTRSIPTAEEVAPWVEAIIRLWDDRELYAEHERRAFSESRRWAPEILEPRYADFFNAIEPRRSRRESLPDV